VEVSWKSLLWIRSPVSLDYFDQRPFAFAGKINKVEVQLK